MRVFRHRNLKLLLFSLGIVRGQRVVCLRELWREILIVVALRSECLQIFGRSIDVVLQAVDFAEDGVYLAGF